MELYEHSYDAWGRGVALRVRAKAGLTLAAEGKEDVSLSVHFLKRDLQSN